MLVGENEGQSSWYSLLIPVEVLAAAAVAAGSAGGAVTNLLFDGAAARHAHVRPARTATPSGC